MRYSSISGDALLTLMTGVLLASSPSLVLAMELPPAASGLDAATPAAIDDLGHSASDVFPLESLVAVVPPPELAAPELSPVLEAPSLEVQPKVETLVRSEDEILLKSEDELAEPLAVEALRSVDQLADAVVVAQSVPQLPPGTPPLPVPLPTGNDDQPDFVNPTPPPSPDTGIGRDPRPEEKLPDEPLPELPPASEILPTPAPAQPGNEDVDGPATINVTGYTVEGSTVFDAEKLAEVTEEFTGDVSFSQLLQARSAVTQLYVDNGYVTSGAFIPPQTLEGGLVKIQVLEGKLEDVRLTGNQRLKPSYVRSRLERAGAEPLNVQNLLEGLKLLQLDPLLGSISADLQAGIQPGTSLLDVKVTETDPFTATVSLDNARSPSVGSFRRKVSLNHANLLGYGDALNLAYSNTDGSNALDLGYTVPLNASNGTLRFAYGRTRSEVIEEPFSPLEIAAKSIYYEGTYRQPVYQTASEELALGLTFSRQESSTKLGFADIGGFPLSPGANEDGETKISALRFFQEWNKRSSNQVLAARSQLSLGTNWFDSNQSSDGGPDSNFFTWRGQGQWVRLLAPDTLALVRGDLQFADRTLVPLEQFGIGGQSSVRGYRQDVLLTDNGLLMSAEVRLPVARIPAWEATLQVAPFLDLGHGWNKDGDNQPEEKTLVGTGLGFIWRQGNNFSARVDWGFPLVDVENEDDTWQENGIYFSVNYNPF